MTEMNYPPILMDEDSMVEFSALSSILDADDSSASEVFDFTVDNSFIIKPPQDNCLTFFQEDDQILTTVEADDIPIKTQGEYNLDNLPENAFSTLKIPKSPIRPVLLHSVVKNLNPSIIQEQNLRESWQSFYLDDFKNLIGEFNFKILEGNGNIKRIRALNALQGILQSRSDLDDIGVAILVGIEHAPGFKVVNIEILHLLVDIIQTVIVKSLYLPLSILSHPFSFLVNHLDDDRLGLDKVFLVITEAINPSFVLLELIQRSSDYRNTTIVINGLKISLAIIQNFGPGVLDLNAYTSQLNKLSRHRNEEVRALANDTIHSLVPYFGQSLLNLLNVTPIEISRTFDYTEAKREYRRLEKELGHETINSPENILQIASSLSTYREIMDFLDSLEQKLDNFSFEFVDVLDAVQQFCYSTNKNVVAKTLTLLTKAIENQSNQQLAKGLKCLTKIATSTWFDSKERIRSRTTALVQAFVDHTQKPKPFIKIVLSLQKVGKYQQEAIRWVESVMSLLSVQDSIEVSTVIEEPSTVFLHQTTPIPIFPEDVPLERAALTKFIANTLKSTASEVFTPSVIAQMFSSLPSNVYDCINQLETEFNRDPNRFLPAFNIFVLWLCLASMNKALQLIQQLSTFLKKFLDYECTVDKFALSVLLPVAFCHAICDEMLDFVLCIRILSNGDVYLEGLLRCLQLNSNADLIYSEMQCVQPSNAMARKALDLLVSLKDIPQKPFSGCIVHLLRSITDDNYKKAVMSRFDFIPSMDEPKTEQNEDVLKALVEPISNFELIIGYMNRYLAVEHLEFEYSFEVQLFRCLCFFLERWNLRIPSELLSSVYRVLKKVMADLPVSVVAFCILTDIGLAENESSVYEKLLKGLKDSGFEMQVQAAKERVIEKEKKPKTRAKSLPPGMMSKITWTPPKRSPRKQRTKTSPPEKGSVDLSDAKAVFREIQKRWLET